MARVLQATTLVAVFLLLAAVAISGEAAAGRGNSNTVVATNKATSTTVSCGDAVNALIPCGTYLLGGGPPEPSADCCKSAKELEKMATTTANRRALCQCLEKTGPSFGVKSERARRLPPACKLQLNIPVSPTYNCALIN